MSLTYTALIPPEVAEVLDSLLAGARAVLGERFIGMYLYGSLATGDFTPERSDIDFLVVTDDVLPDAVVASLAEVHARLAATGGRWFAHLEGSYIPRADMRRYDPNAATHPHLSIGEALRIEQHGADWVIQRWVLREHGVVLAGPAPRTFIDPVTQSELRAAIGELLRGFWARQLVENDFLAPREYQVFAVLSMCRALHTLERGGMLSKDKAARWAIGALDGPWPAIIERALAWPHGDQHDGLDETRALIRHTLERRLE
ncbi:MAG: aminoglycoside adenylyltransferase domain-containing protein [Myxococcota bacterium]